MSSAQLDEHRRRKREQKRLRERQAKTMGLEYYLEMVDHKHRYGSHLRKYHALWKEAHTNENFFCWLDFGDASGVDAPDCTREVLDRDRVRYLSREERQQYLVEIDDCGRLRWVKNGERVTTSSEYRDSMKGIVRQEDLTPPATATDVTDFADGKAVSSDSSDDEQSLNHSQTQAGSNPVSRKAATTYTNSMPLSPSITEASNTGTRRKSLIAVQTLPPAAFLDHLIRKPSKSKKATWIFVRYARALHQHGD